MRLLGFLGLEAFFHGEDEVQEGTASQIHARELSVQGRDMAFLRLIGDMPCLRPKLEHTIVYHKNRVFRLIGGVFSSKNVCQFTFIRRVIFHSSYHLLGGWYEKSVYFSKEKHRKSILSVS